MSFDREQFIADACALAERRVIFRHQGNDPETGMDCVNVPAYLYKLQGLNLPEEMECALRAYDPNTDGKRVLQILSLWLTSVPVEEAQPGDLYLFRGKSATRHLAIKLNGDEIIEAFRNEAEGKLMRWPLDPIRKRLIVAAFRIPERGIGS